jgi:hypothetical protein
MPSSYNYLGIEKMATGENAGTWGDKTNTNLDIIQQAASGYHSQSLNLVGTGANTTVLNITDGDATSVTDALTNASRNQVIKLTGAITGNKIVTFITATEGLKVVFNGTTGNFTVQLKGASDSGAGTTFTGTDKGYKLVYMSGTDLIETTLATSPGGSDTQIQFNSSGAFGGAAGITTDGTNLSVLAAGSLKLSDTDNSDVMAMKANGTTTGYTITWPAAAAGTAGDALTSTTGGALSWTTIVTGTAWQAIKVTGDSPVAAVAGQGYFLNTAAGVITINLPGSPVVGEEISIIDYGSAATNNITVGRNGNNIQGAASDLTVAIDRAGFTLVYDGTAGWLLADN